MCSVHMHIQEAFIYFMAPGKPVLPAEAWDWTGLGFIGKCKGLLVRGKWLGIISQVFMPSGYGLVIRVSS